MPPRSGGTGVYVNLMVDAKGVQAMLMRLDTGFSSVAMAGFLQGVVGQYLQERAEARFVNEGDDVVGRWKPLLDSTQQIRRESGYSIGPAHPINVRSGEMEEYVTGGNGMSVPLGTSQAVLTFPSPSQPQTAELRKKMKTAQKGTKQKGRRATVPRPVIGVGAQDLAFTLGALGLYVRKLQGGLSGSRSRR